MTEKSVASYRPPIFRSARTQIFFFVSAALTLSTFWLMDKVGEWRGAFAPIFVDLFVFGDHSGAICTLLILITAAFFPLSGFGQRMLAWLGDHPLVVALTVFVALCAGSLLIYRNHPLAMDEYVALFQSQVFAAGKLTGQFPAPLLDWLIPKPFQNAFLIVSHSSGQVASVYWPAFALLLTPFTWLGIPWACNPAISAATVLAIHRLALMLFEDRSAAGLAMLLTVASPVFFADGISYYSMSAHLLANAVYVLLLLRPSVKRCMLAGVVGSIALTLHNPVPHILFAAPWMVWMLARENGVRYTLALGAGYLPLSLLLGVGWFLFSSQLAHDGLAVAGQSEAGHISANFSLPTATILLARLAGLAKLWLWAVPGLLLLAGLGAWKLRSKAWSRALVASAVLTFLGYLFVVPDQGHGWGYRYFHSAWLALPILGSGYFFERSSLKHGDGTRGDSDFRQFVTVCALLTLLVGVSFRAFQIAEVMDRQLRRMPDYTSDKHLVVLIDARYSFYGVDLVQNDPFLRAGEIRLLSRSPEENRRLMRQYFQGFKRVHVDQYGEVWEQ
jgi:hypothetical protein